MNNILLTSGITAGLTTIFIKALDKYFDYRKNINFMRESKKLELLGNLMGTAELLTYYHSQHEGAHLACNYYQYYWNLENELKSFYENQMLYQQSRMDNLIIEFAKAKKEYIDCLFQIHKVFSLDGESKDIFNNLIKLKLPVIENKDDFRDTPEQLLKIISKKTEQSILEPSKRLFELLSES